MTSKTSNQFGVAVAPVDARQSDPRSNGIMEGFPPPHDKRVDYASRQALTFPNLRWSLSHWRELAPTRRIWRGPGQAVHFPHKEVRLENIKFNTFDGERVTFSNALDLMYTDSLLVLHRGAIVFETYRGAAEASLPHMAFSMTKSVTGLLACVLIVTGRLDPGVLVTEYVPELKGSAFDGATVRHVLDMQVGAKFSENYPDPDAEIRRYGVPSGMAPAPVGYPGPLDIASYLPTIQRSSDHGNAFLYMTPTTEALSWIMARATGQSFSSLLSEHIWTRLGAEEDASINIDRVGMEATGTGLSLTLRDLARLGEMIRNKGQFGGRAVLPAEVFDELIVPGDERARAVFAKAGHAHLKDWSYRNMWWITNNSHGAFLARGIFGQALYIDPKAEMVLARFSSGPTASSIPSDPLTLPFYAAVADYLLSGAA